MLSRRPAAQLAPRMPRANMETKMVENEKPLPNPPEYVGEKTPEVLPRPDMPAGHPANASTKK
jgi:hypothetical protein